MDETERKPVAEPSDRAVPDAGLQQPEPTVPTPAEQVRRAAPSPPSGADARPEPGARRIDAGNTALLIGIIVGLIGSVSVLIGVPVFLLNEQVNRARDDIDALAEGVSARFNTFENRVDARFNALHNRIDARFAQQDTKFEARFAQQDAKFEARFAQQDAKFEARFAQQDAKFEDLAKGQAEIDRKLTALIASLGRTDAVEAALTSDIPP